MTSNLYIIFPFITIDFASAVEKKLDHHAYYSATSLNRNSPFPKLIKSLNYVPFARGADASGISLHYLIENKGQTFYNLGHDN